MTIRKPLVSVDNNIRELPFGDSIDTGALGSSATSLQVNRTASEDILSGECVKSNSVTHVGLATNDSISSDALVLGVAANDALAGEQVVVVLMGVLNDSSYSVFGLNSLLFLDQAGAISDIRPSPLTANHLTTVGKSLGSSSIFVQISNPTTLS